MKKFNTTAVCIPSRHYMVDLSGRVAEIKSLIDEGAYFTINRARQYGKTTTITALKKAISNEYEVISLDFQGISEGGFVTEQVFVQEFAQLILKKRKSIHCIPESVENKLSRYVSQEEPTIRLSELFITLNEWCDVSSKPVVLIIDEVDSATNM